MQIDATKLKEIDPHYISSRIPDERFYVIPGASRYILSDYGKVYQFISETKWRRVEMKYNGNEYYTIRFDTEQHERDITVEKLIIMVFFPDSHILKLVNRKSNDPNSEWRWSVKELDALTCKAEVIEYISAKINCRRPEYMDYYAKHGFTGRYECKNYHEKLSNTYWDIIARTTNQNTKKSSPAYKDITIDPRWKESIEPFKTWYIDNSYEYPGEVEVDKDILKFGQANIYSPETCCIVPSYINSLFRSQKSKYGYSIRKVMQKNKPTTFVISSPRKINGFSCGYISSENYFEALEFARRNKANEIREVARNERNKKFMPEHILECMEKWADLCEHGLINAWEPDIATLVKDGII